MGYCLMMEWFQINRANNMKQVLVTTFGWKKIHTVQP